MKNISATITTAVSSRVVVVAVPVSAATAAGLVTATCRPSPARLVGPPSTPRIARTRLPVTPIRWMLRGFAGSAR